jgi:transcriptional regulator with XRE-family HTH domain
MSQAEDWNRRELAHFLRSRRERIDPSEVGLPAGPRRRAPGLRREEVGVLAGLSPTWYTYLEQGRNIRPSPEVLDSLARVLRLTEDERRYIHLLTHGQVTPHESQRLGEGARRFVAHLVQMVGPGPYPLYALDYTGEVVAWNDAAVEWYTDWGKREGIERNIVWWMVADPQARERIGDWEADARDIVARARAAWVRYSAEERIQDLIRRLRAESPEFCRWWTVHDVRGQRLRLRRFCHPELGCRTMRLAVVHPEDCPSVTLAFHLPMAEDDEA